MRQALGPGGANPGSREVSRTRGGGGGGTPRGEGRSYYSQNMKFFGTLPKKGLPPKGTPEGGMDPRTGGRSFRGGCRHRGEVFYRDGTLIYERDRIRVVSTGPGDGLVFVKKAHCSGGGKLLAGRPIGSRVAGTNDCG